MPRRALACACLLAAASATIAWTYGTRAASGADSHGYVSQSLAWTRGNPAQPPPLLGRATWPGRVETVTTISQSASKDRSRVVPIYPAGLPLMMAALRFPFGECGPYLVAPFFAAVSVLACFFLARRIGGDGFALGATLIWTLSPAFLSSSMWPMSDVVVTGLWGAAIVLALDGRVRRAAAAGALAGVAVMVRPNLLLVLVAFIAGIAVLERGSRMFWPIPGRALASASAAAPFVAIVAAIQANWYGAPWRSGYGPFSELYDVANVFPNIRLYGSHLISSETPFVLLALVPLIRGALGLKSMVDRRGAVFFTLFVGAFAVSYLPYSQFEPWWSLRFFLPAMLAIVVLAFAGTCMVLSRLGRRLIRPGLAIVTLLVAAWSVYFAITRDVFTQHRYQRAYVSIARYVDLGLPPNAVVISMQHSGSVRYYAGRLTLRWDWMRGRGLDEILADVQRLGFRPYILLEEWEEARFVRRFDAASRAGQLKIPVIARMISPVPVRLFDPLGTDLERERIPEVIPILPLAACPPAAKRSNW